MNHNSYKEREREVLSYMSAFPQKMIMLHGLDNIAEFLLHDLCSTSCFNFKRAAFFVDNPDFNHLKGVAGFSSHEKFLEPEVWQNPQGFTDHHKQSSFNQTVRAYSQPSTKRNGYKEDIIAQELARRFEIKNADYAVWTMKHFNHGLFVYENGSPESEYLKEHLKKSLHLFGFCPVF